MDIKSLFPEFSNEMSAETLWVILEDLGLSGVVLAERLNVDRKTVSRWLKAEVPIPGSVALLMTVAHEMQKFSHAWNGQGIAAQDTPSKRVGWKQSTGARP